MVACCLQPRNIVVCHRREAPLKPWGTAAHTTMTVFLTFLGSIVAALMLLVGRQEGHLACKTFCAVVLFSRCSLVFTFAIYVSVLQKCPGKVYWDP